MKKGDKIRVVRSVEHKKKLSVAMLGNKNRLGILHAEKDKKKISQAMKGNKHTLGKKYGIETKLKDRKAKLGEKNPAWQGGISFEPYSPKFNVQLKQEILERDDFKCQVCGQKDDLHIHHINYDKQNCQRNNLIVLCHSCHAKTNHNRNEWRFINGRFQRMGKYA